MHWWRYVLSLIYPQVCVACGETLNAGEELFCANCRYHLPETDFHLIEENAAAQKFWGRIDVKAVSSMYFFDKGERIQRMIHNLKYRNQPEIGIFLGRKYGNKLKSLPVMKECDCIIPVPLHEKKKFERGYNQSEVFARGLAEEMRVPVGAHVLKRIEKGETQTKKARYQRWENVNELFVVNNPKLVKDKHVLLVDDVLTTGATLEACAVQLLNIPVKSIKIATIAFAH